MLRARFLQDTVLIDNNDFVKYNSERDLDYLTGLELFKDKKVDILNPYYHDDMYKNIEIYEDDWVDFVNNTKNIIREV